MLCSVVIRRLRLVVGPNILGRRSNIERSRLRSKCGDATAAAARFIVCGLLTYSQPDTLVVGVDREIERTAYGLRGLELEGEEE